MARVAVLEEIAKASDPKKVMMAKAGDLKGVELMGNRVLVAIYVAPEKTSGGIIRPTSQLKEDVWQGQVGLVLKKGAAAFEDDPRVNVYFYGQNAQVGEWVVFRPGDARRVQINGMDCRFVEDTLIDMVVSNPELITHDSK
jgi:co-chaperonin GroES (HSP10)